LDEIGKISESEPEENQLHTSVTEPKKINLKEAKKHQLNEHSREIIKGSKVDNFRNSKQFFT
jgi:hypothetical protein